jgi:hypothetical protein
MRGIVPGNTLAPEQQPVRTIGNTKQSQRRDAQRQPKWSDAQKITRRHGSLKHVIAAVPKQRDHADINDLCRRCLHAIRVQQHTGGPMFFMIFMAGILVFIGGMIYGAVLISIPTQWIVTVSLVLLTLSLLTGVDVIRHNDTAD